MKMVSCKVTIENEIVYCKLDILKKKGSCRVMTIENQHGYQGIRGALGDGSRCRGCLGPSGGVRGALGLVQSVGAQGPAGYRWH